LVSFILATGTFLTSVALHSAHGWSLFRRLARQLIADYGTVVMIFVFTALSYAPFLSSPSLPRLVVPASFATTSGRPWWIDLHSLPIAHVFSALLPALILTALIFFDHNVSSLISQDAEFKLLKPSAYNWDLFALGMMLILCGLLGIPPTHGLIPQAPLHVYSLAFVARPNPASSSSSSSSQTSSSSDPSSSSTIAPPAPSSDKIEFSGVLEQRVSNLLQSALTAATLVVLPVLATIPKAVLAGIFLFMGYASFPSNTMAQRCWLLFADRKREPVVPWTAPGARGVPRRHVHAFTLIQLACFGVILGLTYTSAAIAFPVFICLLVPIRLVLLPKLFSTRTLYDQFFSFLMFFVGMAI
jgi:hypothetical protein